MNPTDLALPSRFQAFRPGQLDMAIDVASTDARFPMANAPTGCGKTVLGMAAGALVGGRTLYVVSTKGLQDQVSNEFGESGVVDIRGASNYRCGHHRTGCDVGGEVGCPLRKADGPCPYMAQVRKARQAKTVVTNYAYRLATANQSGESIGEFDLMVLDEAHLAHDALASAASIELNRDVLHRELRAKLPDSLDVDELVAWAVSIAEGASIAARQSTQNRALQRVARAVIRLAALAGRKGEWAADPLVGEEGSSVVVPVWASDFAESMLYRGTPKVLLMSATLLPEMRQYLAIDNSASAWYELPSSFPVARRPFQFVRGTMPIRVDWRMDEGRWGMLVSRVDRYMAARAELGRKGLVHTRSYARQSDFVNTSRHRDMIAAPRSWELRRTVDRFKHSDPPPFVLASPAIEEGYDFAHCVGLDTKVLRSDLVWVSAGDVRSGDRVVAFDEHPAKQGVNRWWREAEVTEASVKMLECWRLLLSDGTDIIASSDHGWLVCHGSHTLKWNTTRRINREGNRSSKLCKLLDVWGFDTSRDAGYLAGAYDGEGSLSIRKKEAGSIIKPSRRLSFPQTDNEMMLEVRSILTRKGFNFKSSSRVPAYPGAKLQYEFLINQTTDVMRFLGEVRPVRLLPKFSPEYIGIIMPKYVTVVAKEFVGVKPVAAIATTTGTFVADGMASHNSAARWQVLLKVPFVDTRSNLMKARAKDKGYSNLLTAQTIIQCAGRIMRASDDYGETALFDDHWDWFRKAVNWPGWFRESWVESEQAPEPLVVA